MLIGQIKAAQVAARKLRNQVAASALTTLIGEAEMVGKNAGREVTDAEVVAVVGKFIKNINETLKALPANDVRSSAYLEELRIYEAFMPQQLDAMRLEMTITGIMMTVGKNTGAIMKELKAGFSGQYDGKLASEIVKRLVAG
jgi:uncharacterized protein YqeY